jgi:hypothetical protein
MTEHPTDETPQTDAWRMEVVARGERRWASNALTFPTRDDALAWGRDLWARWTMADKIRAVPVSHPERETYEVGSEDFS